MDVEEKPASKPVNAPAMFSVVIGAICLFCMGPWTLVIAPLAIALGIAAFFYPAKAGRYYALLGAFLGGVPLVLLVSFLQANSCKHTPFGVRLGRALAEMGGANVARESARRVNCAGNLKQIGLALLFYSGEYGGDFPVELAVLAEDGALDPGKVYSCPSRLDYEVPETAADIRGGKCDYLYFGNGIRDDDKNAAITVLACDRPSNHCCGWLNVLFADGHTEGVPFKDIRAAAKEHGWIVPAAGEDVARPVE